LRSGAGRPKEIRGERGGTRTLYVDRQLDKEFEDLCRDERTSYSEKVRELVVHELESKAIPEQNPLNVKYGSSDGEPINWSDSLIVAGISKIKEDIKIAWMGIKSNYYTL
jgi:hypothetical protein